MRISVELNKPLYCFAYAALGLKVGDNIREVQTVWDPKAWFAYIGLIFVSLSLFIDTDDLAKLLLGIASLITLISLGVIARWIRNSAVQTPSPLAAKSWIALAGLVFMPLFFLLNIHEAYGFFEVGFTTIRDIMLFLVGEEQWGKISEFLFFTPIIFSYFSVVLIALTELLKGLPWMIDEVPQIMKWLKVSFSKRSFVTDRTEVVGISTQPEQRIRNKYLVVAVYASAWMRNIIICITLIMTVVVLVQ